MEIKMGGSPWGYVNGRPVYSRDEYVYARRGFGTIDTDEELIAFAKKASHDWYNAGRQYTFATYYLSDYALDEPNRSLTEAEYKRLRELQQEARAEAKAADEARCWELVDTMCFADNSVEEIWEDRDGVRERRMVVGPHGDAC